MNALEAEDRAVCLLALQTGYRIDDILKLMKENITETGDISCKEAKTGKTRNHVSDDQTKQVIKNLLEIVEKRKGNTSYLIPTRRGRAGDKPTLSRWSIWRAFKRAVGAAGLTGRGYTVHSLRKCYAWNLYKKTRSIPAVQRDLNHDRPDTTFIYLQQAFEAAIR